MIIELNVETDMILDDSEIKELKNDLEKLPSKKYIINLTIVRKSMRRLNQKFLI